VEWEKDGLVRSTRSLSGAQPSPLSVPHGVDGRVERAAVDSLLLSHAVSASAAARLKATAEKRTRGSLGSPR
jgi:hypothetical protein